MNKSRLKNIILNFIDSGVINADLLHQEITYSENNSEINQVDFEKLIIMFKYICEKYRGEIEFEKYDDYQEFFEMVKREYPDIYYDYVIEPDKGEHWKGIYNPSLGFKEKKQVGKIYLSIDKKDLAGFACSLLSNIVENRIDDFNFKINNGEQWNRSDNLVIYLYSTEDLNKYLSIIDEILTNNSQIQINESHLFGTELQEGVVVTGGIDNGNISFSGNICRYICDLIRKGMAIDDIVDCVEKEVKKNDMSRNVIDLDSIIKKAENGELKNLAKSGSSMCVEVDDNYVLVKHMNPQAAEKFANLSKKLGNDMRCICTVIDYKIIGGVVYELQRRAKGEHFRIDDTKDTYRDLIAYRQSNIDSMKKRFEMSQKSGKHDGVTRLDAEIETEEKSMQKTINFTKTDEYAKLVNSRKEELMRRYNLIIGMPEQHLVDFFESVLTLHDNKIGLDNSGNNILYDRENGFSIIDLSLDCKMQNGRISSMLYAFNDQTIKNLLGLDRLREVSEKDRAEVDKSLKQAIIKIFRTTLNFTHNGEIMTREIMENALKTYSEYGIEISYDDILQESRKPTYELGRELFGSLVGILKKIIGGGGR